MAKLWWTAIHEHVKCCTTSPCLLGCMHQDLGLFIRQIWSFLENSTYFSYRIYISWKYVYWGRSLLQRSRVELVDCSVLPKTQDRTRSGITKDFWISESTVIEGERQKSWGKQNCPHPRWQNWENTSLQSTNLAVAEIRAGVGKGEGGKGERRVYQDLNRYNWKDLGKNEAKGQNKSRKILHLIEEILNSWLERSWMC